MTKGITREGVEEEDRLGVHMVQAMLNHNDQQYTVLSISTI